MFDGFIFQYLNELIESEIRDFASPKSFHSVNIERFKAQCIVFPTKLSSKFVVLVKALPCYFSMLSRDCTFGTIPAIRFENFSTQTLIQRSQLVQGLLQELRGRYLATIRTREKRFQSEVKPCALTCLGKPRFRIVNILTTEAYPVIPAIVTLDSDCLDITCYFTMFMEREPGINAIDLKTVVFKFVSRLCKSHRGVFMLWLDMRSTHFTGRFTCFSFIFLKNAS